VTEPTPILGIAEVELSDDQLKVALVLGDGSIARLWWPLDAELRKCLSVDGDVPLAPDERDRAVEARFGKAARWESLSPLEQLQVQAAWRVNTARRRLRATAPVERGGLAAASAASANGKGVTASDLESLVVLLAQDTANFVGERLDPLRQSVAALQERVDPALETLTRRAERHADHLAGLETRMKKLARNDS
jgi:hypothetical protein